MASLEELRKKLYGAREPAAAKERGEFPRRRARRGEEPKTFWGGEALHTYKEEKETGRRKNPWLANVLIFFSIIFVGVAGYIAYELFFVHENISVTIAGPQSVETGARADFAVFVKNGGQVALRSIELNITYPDHAIALAATGEPKGVTREQVTFDSIRPGEEVKYDIAAKFLGKVGDQETISAIVIYQPENIQSRLTQKASFTAAITRSPLVITFQTPEELSSGQEVQIPFTVSSQAQSVLENVSFRVDYPQGFTFESADPAPAYENNIWSLGNLSPGDERTITLTGRVTGQPEEAKTFNAVVGQYNPATKEWVAFLEEAHGPKIASPFLFVQQSANGIREGIVHGGDNLSFSISYKNNLSKAISNVTITETLSENVLNLSTLRVSGGAYDPVSHEIRWTPATLPQLAEIASGDSGTVAFTVNLRPSPPLATVSDKNFSLTANAVIDTQTIPEEFRGVSLRYADSIAFKIGTKLTLSTRATYVDSPVPNTGPLPPKARKETTYTIYWQLANQSNDAANVEVKGGLPPNVRWLGTVGDVPGSAVFDSAAGMVLWDIPRVTSGTGIVKPQATLVFRVALTPGEDQIGASPPLVSGVTFDAVDAFTNEKLHDAQGPITTELNADTKSSSDQWKVVP